MSQFGTTQGYGDEHHSEDAPCDGTVTVAGPALAHAELTDKHLALARERTELADQRTEWAEHRTLLTRDLAFSAWVRTGLTAVVAGVGIVRLVGDLSPSWLARSVGIAFVAAGGVMQGIAFLHYLQERADLRDDDGRLVHVGLLGLITLMLLVGAVLALILLLVW